jgi:hypothetical protein
MTANTELALSGLAISATARLQHRILPRCLPPSCTRTTQADANAGFRANERLAAASRNGSVPIKAAPWSPQESLIPRVTWLGPPAPARIARPNAAAHAGKGETLASFTPPPAGPPDAGQHAPAYRPTPRGWCLSIKAKAATRVGRTASSSRRAGRIEIRSSP